MVFFFSSRRRHTRFDCDWSSDVCSSDLSMLGVIKQHREAVESIQPSEEFGYLKESARNAWESALTRGQEAGYRKIGRASCRERVEISVGAGAGKKEQERPDRVVARQ